jgi:hypothetical protein
MHSQIDHERRRVSRHRPQVSYLNGPFHFKAFSDLHVRHNTEATPSSILWLANHVAHIIEGTVDKHTDLEGKGNVRR